MTQLTGFKTDIVGSWISKDPGAVLTYSIDWTDWMPDGDSIASTTWAVSTIAGDSTPLVITASGRLPATEKTYVELDNGTASEIYTITNTIVTVNGLTDVRRFRVKVEQRYL